MTDQEEQELVIKDKKYVLHYDLVNIDKFNPKSTWVSLALSQCLQY